jgi:flagellar basal body P-ring formation protein FlgA
MTTFFRHLMLAAAAIPAVADAQSFQTNDDIDAQIAAALASGGLNALPVDRRLKMAACPERLQIAPPVRRTVAVHCVSLGWRIYALVDDKSVRDPAMPIIIKRGDPVTVDFVAPGFSVTADGVSENDARIGERVRVRVSQKSGPVVGDAIDVGAVRVGGLK